MSWVFSFIFIAIIFIYLHEGIYVLKFKSRRLLIGYFYKLVFAVLNKLKKIGISIAIDDFGTEYTSLAYLKSCLLRELKF